MEDARTAITVALISLGGTVFTAIVGLVIWILTRRAEKSDRNSKVNKEYVARIEKLEANQELIGELLNKQSVLQKKISDGVCYIIDGLETKNIMNGTGKKFLHDIDDYYKQEGFQALKFHSIDTSKKKTGTEG